MLFRSYWRAMDGQPLPTRRMVDRARRLQAKIPEGGALDLRIRPPGLALGLCVQALGVLGVVAVAVFGRRRFSEPA